MDLNDGLGQLDTCIVNQTIGSEDYFLGSKFNTSVERFQIQNNREVKYLPKQIGEKFPNLKVLWVLRCGLVVVRNHYFKSMANLRHLVLAQNQITSIEPDSFKDLARVRQLILVTNMLVTLDEKLFASMVELDALDMSNNKISVLSPATFRILGGKPKWYVNSSRNGCIDGYYSEGDSDRLEADIRANCTQ